MEVDAVTICQLSKAECEVLQKNGGCFYCHETGHIARECPKKRRTNQLNAIMTEDDAIIEASETKN